MEGIDVWYVPYAGPFIFDNFHFLKVFHRNTFLKWDIWKSGAQVDLRHIWIRIVEFGKI